MHCFAIICESNTFSQTLVEESVNTQLRPLLESTAAELEKTTRVDHAMRISDVCISCLII